VLVRDFANTDFDAFNMYLLAIDWSALLVTSYDVNTYWKNFWDI
jgi:hypothetical protein